jgi:hypothetical protein
VSRSQFVRSFDATVGMSPTSRTDHSPPSHPIVLPCRSSPWVSYGSASSPRRTDRPEPEAGDPPRSGVARPSTLPVDEGVAHAWAALCVALRDAGKRMPINDSWIAATAIANDLAVASQDGDYDDIPGLRVIRI